MKKIVINRPGGYEQLTIAEVPNPVPRDHEVLVQTSAVGVNYADVCVRWGVYESAKKFVGWPITPGFEFSGKVVARGKAVTKLEIGDEVFGVTFFNGYSTHIAASDELVWRKPKSLTTFEAAGFPAVFLTAYHALFQNVRIRPGMKVLIHSAGGGVGSALVQLAKISSLHVTAVVGSAHKVDYVRSLGADYVIDKSSEDLWSRVKELVPEGFDIVFDANGPETLRQSYDRLRPTGKLVVYGFHSMLPKEGGKLKWIKAGLGFLRIPRFNPLTMTSDNKSIVAFNLSFLFPEHHLLNEGMAELVKWLDEKRIKPPHITEFRLEDVALAHKLLESGKSIGKIILKTGF